MKIKKSVKSLLAVGVVSVGTLFGSLNVVNAHTKEDVKKDDIAVLSEVMTSKLNQVNEILGIQTKSIDGYTLLDSIQDDFLKVSNSIFNARLKQIMDVYIVACNTQYTSEEERIAVEQTMAQCKKDMALLKIYSSKLTSNIKSMSTVIDNK